MYKKACLSFQVSAVVFLSACAALDPIGLVPEAQQDAVVAAKVKAELIEEKSLDAAAIRVESNAGAVTIDGFVDNQAQKERAGNLARGVPGVSRVDNQLKVH